MAATRQLGTKDFETAIEDALKNNTPLLSWKSALNCLTAPSRSPLVTRNLRSWLLATPQLTALTTSYVAFPPPSAAGKQALETKTAMINITADTTLPVAEIKADALKLSQDLNLDEIEALKICILAFQERSPSKEDEASDPEESIGFIPTASMFTRSTAIKKDRTEPKSVTERHDRQVFLYFSERRYKIKVATALVRIVTDQGLTPGEKHPFYITAKKILKKMVLEGKKNGKGFVETLITDIGKAISQKTVPRALVESRTMIDQKDSTGEWERQLMIEEYHLLQFLFILMYGPIAPSSSIVASWYQLMRSTAFLTDQKYLSKPPRFDHTLANNITPFAALISLQVLAVSSLESRLGGTHQDLFKELNSDAEFYLFNQETANLVTTVLTEFVAEGGTSKVATLAAFSWAVGLSIYNDWVYDAKDFIEGFKGDVNDGSPGTALIRANKTLGSIMAASTYPEGPALPLARGAIRGNLLGTIRMLIGGAPIGNWSIRVEEDGGKMQYLLASLMRLGMRFLGWDNSTVETFISTHSQLPIIQLASKAEDENSEVIDDEKDEEEGEQSSSTALIRLPTASVERDFWSHPDAVARTLTLAMARFPFEALPFCAILRATTPRTLTDEPLNLGHLYLKDHMVCYTDALPNGFRGTEVDEDDASNIVLLENLEVVPGRRQDGGGAYVLPAGILGKIVSEGVSPPIVRWDYQYAGVPLLGRMLERVLLEERFFDADVAIQILGVFENILVSYANAPLVEGETIDEDSGAKALLEEASDMLAPNSDIISVVLDLFESSLPFSVEKRSVDLAIACLRLINALIPIVPGRVWPLMGRSSLLERNGRGGLLVRILESVEIVQGDFTFLLTVLELYEKLLSDAISGAVYSGTIGAPGSIVGGAGVGSGVSGEMQSAILQDWTRFWCSIFGSFTTWKYLRVDQRQELSYKLCSNFSRIFRTVYGVISDQNNGFGLFNGISASATIICNTILDEESTTAIDPILLAINEGLQTIDTTLHLLITSNWITSSVSALQFAAMALKVQHHQGRRPSHLEKELYARSPSLIALYEVHERYRRPVIDLLDGLISGSNQWIGEPPSILGYILPSGANHLVGLLQRLGGRLGDEALECAIWRFFCTVITNKQQGLSIKLVTGKNLEDKTIANGKTAKPKESKSMLALALEVLFDITNLSAPLLLATLEAVSVAQDFWGPIITNLPTYLEFLNAVTSYVAKLKINFLARTQLEVTDSCNKTAAAAHIAQILTMHLYQSRTMGSKNLDARTVDFFSTLLSKLQFYFDSGVTISGYKPSMHGLLARNFPEKWKVCNLENFRKSPIQERRYGVNYFYDIDLADQILSWDRGWNRVITRKLSDRTIETRTGFKADVEIVNINLALVDSQVFLLDRWSNLALELTWHKIFHNAKALDLLSKTIIDALKAGMNEQTPPNITPTLNLKRSWLAFSLLRRLELMDLPSAQVGTITNNILDTIWQVVATVESDFVQSLSKGGNETSRNFLRLLYLALRQSRKHTPQPSPKTMSLLVGVFEVVVSKGFKALATVAYENPAAANPGDMLLVIGILQAILSFESIEPLHEHFVTHLANHGTIRTATILFTWANKLGEAIAEPGSPPDPLYGEISITFLAKLAALPILAEQIALNSVFNSLSEGDLANKIQAGQLLPTTSPRLHNIWAKGFLPLLLSILYALDRRIAPEIIQFLRSFIRQVVFTISYLDKPEFITLPHLEEVADLTALLLLLDRMGTNINDELIARLRGLEGACEQIINHRAWLSKVLVATTAEEDLLMQSNKLAEKVVEQAKLVRGLVSVGDGEETAS